MCQISAGDYHHGTGIIIVNDPSFKNFRQLRDMKMTAEQERRR